MTSNSVSLTHHTMMSSTTKPSSFSRCVYCARPGATLRRSLVSVDWSASNMSGPSTAHRAEVADVEDDRVVPAGQVLADRAGAVLQGHLPTPERYDLGP